MNSTRTAAVLVLLLFAQPVTGAVWTDVSYVESISGAGDMFVAATHGGVVLWNRSAWTSKVITTAQGLPSQVVLQAQMHPVTGQVLACTSNGIARGAWDGPWESIFAGALDTGRSYHSALALANGGWIVGGTDGHLVYWNQDIVQCVTVPGASGRIVELVSLADWDWSDADSLPRPAHADQIAGAPGFPVGLTVVTESSGVWILTRHYPAPQWLHWDQNSGLPSAFLNAAVRDQSNHLWLATWEGVLRVSPDGTMSRWPVDPFLSQRVRCLLTAPSGHVYLGLEDGMARIVPGTEPPIAEPTPWGSGNIVDLAWNDEGLWWSDSERIESFRNTQLLLPESIAAAYGYSCTAQADTLWFGHTYGQLSRWVNGTWTRFDQTHGLPYADLLSLMRVGDRLQVGSFAGYYDTDTRQVPLQFANWDEGPPGLLRTQVWHQSQTWIGSNEGLWRTHEFGWEQVPLPAGSQEVFGLASVGDRLWAGFGYGGIAFQQNGIWQRPYLEDFIETAYYGDIAISPQERVAVATNRGVAMGDGEALYFVHGGPVEFVYSVEWSGKTLAVGTRSGLWLWNADYSWKYFSVLDGLPGSVIRDICAVGNRFWLATTRGVGWMESPWPEAEPPRPHEPSNLAPVVTWSQAGLDIPDSRTATGLSIFDVRGRLVLQLGPDWRHKAAPDMARGIYWLRVERRKGRSETHRLLRLR